ncbi:unnamed protein product, partial [marine sediment metagenome]
PRNPMGKVLKRVLREQYEKARHLWSGVSGNNSGLDVKLPG